MQTATIDSTVTPVTSAKGFSPVPGNSRCLLPSSVLLETIIQAKQQRDHNGRGNGYAQLLAHFHKAILPAFLVEAGSLSEAARLLGIHRETLRNYADQAGIDTNATPRAGGAKCQ